jgi:acyl carrier protein
MTDTEVDQSLRVVISSVGHVPQDFAADADLYDQLGLDSFRMAEIFLEVERRFAVSISEDDYLGLRSLNDFRALLQRSP